MFRVASESESTVYIYDWHHRMQCSETKGAGEEADTAMFHISPIISGTKINSDHREQSLFLLLQMEIHHCGVSQAGQSGKRSAGTNITEEGTLDVDRIVGGWTVTSQQKYPWMAYFGECEGALINDRYVLTAAHCISTEAATDNNCAALKGNVVHYSTVSRWLKRLESGDTTFRDRPRSGLPSTVDDEALRNALNAKPNATTRESATILGVTHMSIGNHLNDPGYRKVYSTQSGKYTVTLGDLDKSTDTESRTISISSRAIVHPQYNQRTRDNDIALLKLDYPVNFQANPNIRPICLSSSAQPSTGQAVAIAGWGSTYFGGSGVSVMRETVVNVDSQTTCQNAYNNQITSNMFCASASGRDACQVGKRGTTVNDENLQKGKAELH
ncbi:unnamed protein product [Darwinula stevensoni]|uniref:Peptidase S1 domain-containing protein n=1 Tax=Darwinula stevensoni TaxID=69355 RepID=A0A7R9ADB3_9CRUS|nr:unnamed protein product [Darwinula stevensoni]CAG0901146.1 unnamed protein product [Darwinula stevensoni]